MPVHTYLLLQLETLGMYSCRIVQILNSCVWHLNIPQRSIDSIYMITILIPPVFTLIRLSEPSQNFVGGVIPVYYLEVTFSKQRR